ncbi:MAG: hypothetical protein ACFCVD_02115 [Nodosilinea sp.]
MPNITLQIEESDRLRQTPITPEDIEDILSLLGHSRAEITAARIEVSASHATVQWTNETDQIAA